MRHSENSLTNESLQLDFLKVKAFEQRLDDVMEVIDVPQLMIKIKMVEEDFKKAGDEINRARLGIIYHEIALNLSFLSKSEFKGYAKRSSDILSELIDSPSVSVNLLPFVASYRASALSLVSAETGKLKFLRKAFQLFDDAVEKYSSVCYAPEFMRGSVAENLPWIFFSKRKFARRDFQSIIDKQERNEIYANSKIMSFTYWARAKQFRGRKFRKQALLYLDRAIALDPNYIAGRKRAEELKIKLQKEKAP